MFTGIISDQGILTATSGGADNLRLTIACDYAPETIGEGASIACNGICLTVVAKGSAAGEKPFWFTVEASPQTQTTTTITAWKQGDRINLERALRLGDELGGHLVSGHVDGVAMVEAVESSGESRNFTLSAPMKLARFIAAKGSVTLDGTSLTVTWAEKNRFGLTLIPHTLAVTGWGQAGVGQRMNLEVDLLARYVARLREDD